jgi:hypothetical protein
MRFEGATTRTNNELLPSACLEYDLRQGTRANNTLPCTFACKRVYAVCPRRPFHVPTKWLAGAAMAHKPEGSAVSLSFGGKSIRAVELSP